MNRDNINDASRPAADRKAAVDPHASADLRIDHVLRSIGSATPDAGFEGRVLDRLAAARLASQSKPSPISWLSRFSRQALGLVTACGLCLAIIAGSVSHSRRLNHAAPPALPLAGQGIGAASAVHPAAPASPAPAGEPGRASRSSDQGRARIAPHSRKAPGAVPAPPVNKGTSDSQ